MSYEQKYLKYKAKYLRLKNQSGGAKRSIYSSNIFAIDHLTETPSLDMFKRMIGGADEENDVETLANASSNDVSTNEELTNDVSTNEELTNDISTNDEYENNNSNESTVDQANADSEQSGGDEEEYQINLDSEQSGGDDNEEQSGGEDDENLDDSDNNSQETTPEEVESEQTGGRMLKIKIRKSKYDDSDCILKSTESELSSMDSSVNSSTFNI